MEARKCMITTMSYVLLTYSALDLHIDFQISHLELYLYYVIHTRFNKI